MTASVDQFAGFVDSLDSPAFHALAVTPSDTVDLVNACRALWIGVSGNVTVNTAGGELTITFVGVPVGWLQVRCLRVLATSTTATSIVAVW